MGLDSVMLVMDIEKHFDIRIPDAEAETLYTVGDLVNAVYKRVKTNPADRCKSLLLFNRFRSFFMEYLAISREDFVTNRNIDELIKPVALKDFWKALSTNLNLELPPLSTLDTDPHKNRNIKFLGVDLWRRNNPTTAITVGELINSTIAINHKKLIDPKNLCSKADVKDAIMGIISEDIGIPVHEIKLEHRFTDDLGVD